MIKCLNPYSGADIPLTITTFPAGEQVVRLDKGFPSCDNTHLNIIWNYQSDSELFLIAQLVDLLRTGCREVRITLFCPYFPHARMDRQEGLFAFSLKTMTRFVNSLNFHRVIVDDPHSDVTPALLDNVEVFPQALPKKLWSETNVILVSPDAGAEKKIRQVASALPQVVQIIYGSKHRDPTTGNLTGFTFNDADVSVTPDSVFIFVDDICDGGGTFLGLAEVMKAKYPDNRYILYTTHGIYSKTLAPLEAVFDKVECTYLLP